MKFKKFLAGAVAAALAVVSLPQVMSAAQESSTQKITIKGTVANTIKVSPDGTINNSYNNTTPVSIKHEVTFDTDFEVETMPSTVYVIYDVSTGPTSSYAKSVAAQVTRSGSGKYIFTFSVSENEEIGNSATAYMRYGKNIATANVDLRSETATFTLKNNKSVTFVNTNTEFDGGNIHCDFFKLDDEGNITLQIDTSYSDVFSGKDTFYLPVGSYRGYLSYSPTGSSTTYSKSVDFDVADGENTVKYSFTVPDEYITIYFDISNAPGLTQGHGMLTMAYLNKDYNDNWNQYYSNYSNKKAVQIPADYVNSLATFFLSSDFASNDQVTYTLFSSLSDGYTVKLGTNFETVFNNPYSWSDAVFASGSTLYLYSYGYTDQFGNSASLYLGSSLSATVTFTNVNDPEDVIPPVDVDFSSNSLYVPLSEKMDGEYKVDVTMEYVIPANDVITNTSTGIEASAPAGVLPDNAKLEVEVNNNKSTKDRVVYDITVTANGKPADINGNVTVTIPIPEELKGSDEYYVFYRDENGKLTDMNASYDKASGSVTFTTSHFSEYIVTTRDLSVTIRGDVNGSGDKPNNDDLITLAQYLANWDVYIDMEAANVDGDKDGNVNNDDLIMLAQMLAGWNV